MMPPWRTDTAHPCDALCQLVRASVDTYRIIKCAAVELEKQHQQLAGVVWWHLAPLSGTVLLPDQVRDHHVAQGKATQPARVDLVQVLRVVGCYLSEHTDE